MKLHKVRMYNLNSLYGEHIIDFENDLRNAPLFLILGQTGAGKSTILDAICLALFGQTPRLSGTRGRPETDARLIMSHGTSDCCAEVEFSRLCPNGERKRYRAVWTCRRSRGRADGRLQDPERSLTLLTQDGIEELLISDKRAKYYNPVFSEHLEQITVQDFQRSVLLAQGEFAAFLRADEKEKASILERLTNTDMYKTIGQRAAAKRRSAKKELEHLEQKLGALNILTEPEEKELSTALTELEQQAEKKRVTQAAIREVLLWLDLQKLHQKEYMDAERSLAEDRERFASRADDIKRLEAHEACESAEPILKERDEITQTAEKLQKECTLLKADEKKLNQSVEDAHTKLEAREALKKQAQSEKEDAEPILEEAQLLAGSLEQTQKDVQQAQKALLNVQKEERECTQILEKARKELAKREEEYAIHRTAFEASEPMKMLVSEYAGLASHTKHIADIYADMSEAEEEYKDLKKKKSALQKKLQSQQKKTELAQETLAPFAERLARAEKKKTELLDDSTDLRSRRELLDAKRDTCRQQSHFVEESHRIHASLVERVQRLHTSEQEHEQLEWSIQEVKPQIELKKREDERLEDTLTALNTAIRFVELQLSLYEKRHALKPDGECPLCGSTEHPYLQDDSVSASEVELHKQSEQLEATITHTKHEQKEIREALLQLDLERTKKESTKEQLAAQMKLDRGDIDKLFEEYVVALKQLDTEAPEHFPVEATAQKEWLDFLRDKQAVCEARSAEVDAQIKALDDLRDELESATQELEKSRKEVDEFERLSQQLEQRIALREEELVKAKTHYSHYVDKWKEETDAICEQLTSFSIHAEEPLTPQSLDAAIDLAKQKKDMFEKAARDMEQGEEYIREGTYAVEQAQHAWESVHKQVVERCQEVEERIQKEKDLLLTQRALLGEESLQQMKRRLEKNLEGAQKAYDSMRDTWTGLREEHTRLHTLYKEKESTLRQTQDALTDAETQLVEKLLELEISSVHVLREYLVPPEERMELRSSLKEIRQALERSQLQLQTTQEKIDEHSAKKPTLENWEEASYTSWKERASTLQDEIGNIREEMGVLREKMEQHEEAKNQASQFTKELQEAREAFRTWETLDRIIGVGDGDAFKQFAQSLNLQELVDRANVRLLRLNPRYTLAVARGDNGEPKLNFVIRDRHHADHERPLTTLSGGETFLVSLALALALADFRRIDMPIETLLLDEGFGTLDQETLDIAMSTLRQLQQESEQQIGLISHVEMLKERIDTRIIVEKIGNGRSILSVEGVPTQPQMDLTSVTQTDAA